MTANLVWFRRDLRLSDNPALLRAAQSGTVLPVFILEDNQPLGGASRAWLHRSLHALNTALNGTLRCFTGNASEILPQLIDETGATTVTWTRRCGRNPPSSRRRSSRY